jgi:hypothetical protein
MKRIHTRMVGPMGTNDGLLTTLSPAESAAEARRVAAPTDLDLGMIWDGVMRTPAPAESFGALPANIQDALIETYGAPAQQLAAYSKASAIGGALTAVTTITDRRSRATDGASAAGATRDLMRAINCRNVDFWQGRQRDTGIKPRDAVQAQLQAINARNRDFWASLNGVGVRR